MRRDALKEKIAEYDHLLHTKADYVAKAKAFKAGLATKQHTIDADIAKAEAELASAKGEGGFDTCSGAAWHVMAQWRQHPHLAMFAERSAVILYFVRHFQPPPPPPSAYGIAVHCSATTRS